MFVYEKKLQYPVKIKTPNPAYAKIIMTQFGGPDGELGASIRYLSQRFSMPYPQLAGVLTDIGICVSKLHILKVANLQAFLNGMDSAPINNRYIAYRKYRHIVADIFLSRQVCLYVLPVEIRAISRNAWLR